MRDLIARNVIQLDGPFFWIMLLAQQPFKGAMSPLASRLAEKKRKIGSGRAGCMQAAHLADDLNDAKAFLETILGNLSMGVVVVDHEFRILTWNCLAEDLWGLRLDEVVGQSLLNLDIGLPVEQLKAPVHAIIEEKSDIREIVLNAVNGRGKSIQCRVTCTPFSGVGIIRQGVVLIMNEINEKV